jgi:hypothetical protein
MRKLMKKAALMAAKKASRDMFENIGKVGANILPGLAGEIELKNGRRIMVESVGTSTEPKFFISFKAKRPSRTLKQTIVRILALTVGCIGGVMLVNRVFGD